MNYPRYTREQNLSCKLTESQIHIIPALKEEGWTVAKIGEIYGVSPSTISYWSLSQIERKRRNKLQYSVRIRNDIDKPQRQSKSKKRKWRTSPIFRKWQKAYDKKWRKKNNKEKNNRTA